MGDWGISSIARYHHATNNFRSASPVAVINHSMGVTMDDPGHTYAERRCNIRCVFIMFELGSQRKNMHYSGQIVMESSPTSMIILG